jgi:CDP-diacylglycerol--serine O-phosphatidyltransferase
VANCVPDLWQSGAKDVTTRNNNGANRRKGIYLLPNLFTTAALFAGFYSIIAAIDGNMHNAAVAIFVAMVLDGLDGRVARLTRTESDFGKEYDSLSDMVCFGLAPALVTYQWGIAELKEHGWLWSKLGWLAAFVFAVSAALRLARFNSRADSSDKRFFEGLPSPSAAGLVAAVVWLVSDWQATGTIALVIAFLFTAGAGGLMVSSFRYYSFKDINLGRKVPFAYVLAIPLIFVFISFEPPVVLFLMFFGYALTGPLLCLYRRNRPPQADKAASEREG